MGRGDLSDAEWKLIGPLLPPERGRWAPTDCLSARIDWPDRSPIRYLQVQRFHLRFRIAITRCSAARRDCIKPV